LDALRPDIASAAEGISPGVARAIAEEPAQVVQFRWDFLIRRMATGLIVAGLWWLSGGRKAKEA
jgi:hypothetical protein